MELMAEVSGLSPRCLPQTVQILIGLIHLGFGSVLLMVRRGHLGMLFIEGGVPFWGGACVSARVAILCWGVFLPSSTSSCPTPNIFLALAHPRSGSNVPPRLTWA